MDLHDRRVLVTGASRGIGADLARHFAAAGAQVALVARSAEPIAELPRRITELLLSRVDHHTT